MGEGSEAGEALHAGGEDGGGAAGVWASSSASSGIGTASRGSSSSLFSSTSLGVGDEEEDGDGATSSSRPADRRRFSSFSSLSSLSSTSSESEASQMNGAAGGPLYGMSTLQDHLPQALSPSPRTRTGLSMYYKGRSESFTTLADVTCLEDLAKKTIPYIRRPKASIRRHAAALGVKNRLSKTVAKRAPTGRKPSAAYECHGKRELYRC